MLFCRARTCLIYRLPVSIVYKSGSLNLLESSGPVFYLYLLHVLKYKKLYVVYPPLCYVGCSWYFSLMMRYMDFFVSGSYCWMCCSEVCIRGGFLVLPSHNTYYAIGVINKNNFAISYINFQFVHHREHGVFPLQNLIA
jgi:hypothetical protein